MKNALKLIPTVFLAVLLFCGVSFATTITYLATDLTDPATGEDLWQYEYTVSDNTFNIGEVFTIWFDLDLYERITPISANAEWDPIALQPDPGIPDDGAYDAEALINNASLSDAFVVSFLWLGSDAPGTQSFEVYDADFNLIESGETAPIPEPGTIVLLGIGLLGLAGFGRKSKNIS